MRRAAAPRGWLRAVVVAMLAIACSSRVATGFVGFLSQLRGVEAAPASRADGIVVLTGGSSRVSDAHGVAGRRATASGC